MGSHASESEPPAPPLPRATLLSVRTGKVRPFGNGLLTSGINKQPRAGKVLLTKLGFAGDEREFPPHRSPDNAVHQYDAGHYERWKADLPDLDADKFAPGAFGENITTTTGLSEDNVCIGDKFRLGLGALVQVSMTRQPCYKINHRFEYKKMSSLVQKTGRTGWYYRVLEEGLVEEGDEMVLVERPNPTWSLARLQHYLYTDRNNVEAMTELVALPGLSEEMLNLFKKRLEQGREEDMNGRLQGDVATPWSSYTVVEKTRLTPRVQRFVLAADDHENMSADEAAFSRLAHVRIKFGIVGSKKFTRAYSVVSGDMRRFELGIAKDDNSRGGSAYLHGNIAVGDKLQVAKGHSKREQQQQLRTKKHIFIIGGIGITAFIAEIQRLGKEGGCSDKDSIRYEVHYAVRSRAEAAFLDRLPSDDTIMHLYPKSEGKRLPLRAVISDNDDPSATMIYCCGPNAMIQETRSLTQELGYPESRVHFEDFGGSVTATGEEFEVEVKDSGRVLKVPGDKTLLQVLSEAGFGVEGSCLVGSCGTCLLDYSGGVVEHRGVAISEEMKKTSLLACVSRARGRVVVDC
ncbi:PK beta-barrel-protein domain-containing protein-like protein [Xylariaceae sp. FL0594]|nr:PK beta-barrel-protein domain-containing protein-like protein [Xylariaceae sp. FL0594]